MAGNVVASLRVLLGLDAAEFQSGISKADYQAKKFAQSVRQEMGGAIKEVAKIIGGLEIGRQIYESTKAIIEEAASLNDLADATGSSVEGLSRLNNQAKIAGTDFATLQNAVLKLSAGMAGADEESTKAKEALRILGITTKDPVEALQQVAVELNKYQDGVNKVGLAVALFGKQGAQFVATLKDIAELQDVGATVSAKQAAEAENLQKQFARLSVEAQGFKNVVLNDLVPALADMIEEMRIGTRVAGGFFSAFLNFGTLDLGKVDAEIARVSKEMADLESRSSGGVFTDLNGEVVDSTKKLELMRRQLEYLGAIQAKQQKQNAGLRAAEDRGFDPRQQAPNPPASGDKAKQTREQASEAERLLATLQRQHQATLDLTAAQTADIAITELAKNAKSGMTDAIASQIRAFAAAIDQNKEAKRVADEQRKADEEAERARERYIESQRRSAEAAQREIDAIRQSTESVREQIIGLTQGEAALDAYVAAKREALAVEKELRAANLRGPGFEEEAQSLRDAAAALRELNAASNGLRVAENLKRQAEAVADLKGQIFDIAGNAVSDLIVNGAKASDVLKRLERDLLSFLTNQALMGLKNQVTGQGGGDFFSTILGLFAGGSGGGVPGVGFSGGGFGEHFASGGISRGGVAMVGENGPELVNLPRGAQVYSNPETQRMLGGKSVHITQNITVQPGANTQSARQIANRLYSVTASAARDR